jgi:ABC-2 type transport system ATP-binding protein
VDGPTNEIRQKYKSNIFEIKYKGNFEQVDQALGRNFKILEHTETERDNQLQVQYLNGDSNNDLLQAIMPVAEILSFEEIIPSMNDVFIKAVNESNNQKK